MFRLRLLLVVVLALLLALPGAAQDDPLISLGSADMMGEFLVGPDGMTLYMFTRDPLNESACSDNCAANWPPLLVDDAMDITVADGVPGVFTTVERSDGTLQVAVNGMPLYYFAQDEAPGDTVGQGRGNVWYIVPPATVYAFRHGDLPPFLVDSAGITLYMFTNDSDGESVCYDDCAVNWPPLLVESEDDLVKGLNLLGELGVTERTDDTLQVTYNGMPLYYWKDDAAPGDTDGDGRGDVWYTVVPETLGVSSNDDLGDFLVAQNGMTVYLFTNDEEGVSNCADTCAENWPPVSVNVDNGLVPSPDMMGELGTITRADDSIQLTYNGMPLYFFAQDEAPGDTTGQGRGDVWYVVEP